jgi:hypothetical protein
MTKRQAKKPYWEMNAEELAKATAEFDEEFVIDRCTRPPPEMQARWEAAKRKPPRSDDKPGAAVISVYVDKDLLARSDALARKKGLSRSSLIARGLKAVLAAEGEI